MNLEIIEVGILSAPALRFRLNGNFLDRSKHNIYNGEYFIEHQNESIWLKGDQGKEVIGDGFTLIPQKPQEAWFELVGVTIGIHFHWEREENQKFRGTLKILNEKKCLTAVNILSVEEYLKSVISSEMSATSSIELLKAHAIISRSWLLAQKLKKGKRHTPACAQNADEYIQWFDREDHERFDVCADDHCQRYQGITRAHTPAVEKAVETTRGKVLTFEKTICDTRFSKCCGGVTEVFESAWENAPHPYLTRVIDAKQQTVPDLRQEENARAWILGHPQAFCNTNDAELLSTTLNDYDQVTQDFFRWEISYSADELSSIVKKKSGIDFGRILSLEAVERGVSGRITRLKIIGSKRTLTIGKELFIRQTLSPTHLYSSAFVVETKTDLLGNPSCFTLHGAGWGHGVGLCQIGAAAMSAKGYSYEQILSHYFPGTTIENIADIKSPKE